MFILETERLTIRHFTLDDAEFILRLLNEPSFIKNIADRGVRTVEQAATYLRGGPMKSYQVHGHGLYLVSLKGSLQPIGMCGLIKRERLEDVDIGYALLPEFWSKGYALESVSAVLEFGRRSLGLTKVVAIVNPDNEASKKVLTRVGFSFSRFVHMEPNAPEVALYELHQP